MKYNLVLKSLKVDNERIVLEANCSIEYAQAQRKAWRKVLGDKHWTIDRRPGLDTLDHLVLTVERSTIG